MANLCGSSAQEVDLSGGPTAGCAPSGIWAAYTVFYGMKW